MKDLHLQGAQAGAPRRQRRLQGHVHHELLCQRHLREARRASPGNVQSLPRGVCCLAPGNLRPRGRYVISDAHFRPGEEASHPELRLVATTRWTGASLEDGVDMRRHLAADVASMQADRQA